jgi:hypothetical protein
MALTDVGECASSQGLFHVTTAARSAALRRSESRRGMFEACAEPDRQPSPRLISRSPFLPQVPGSIIKNCVGSLAGQGDDPVDYRRVAVVLVVPHRYTAITQILIDPTGLSRGRQRSYSDQSSKRRSRVASREPVRVLTSDGVLRRVAKADGLENDPEFIGHRAGDAPTALPGPSTSSSAASK